MTRKLSKVDRLIPREVIEELHQLYRDDKLNIDELLAWVREKQPDANISRSGLHRHLSKFEASFARIRVAKEAAARWVEKLGENPRGDIGRMLTEMLGAVAMTSVDEMGDGSEEKSPDTKDLFFMSAVIKNLVSAEKTSVDRELKIRALVKAELEKKMEAAKPKADAPQDAVAAFERAREILRGAL